MKDLITTWVGRYILGITMGIIAAVAENYVDSIVPMVFMVIGFGLCIIQTIILIGFAIRNSIKDRI